MSGQAAAVDWASWRKQIRSREHLYCYGMPAPLKALLDRTLIPEEQYAAIVNGGV